MVSMNRRTACLTILATAAVAHASFAQSQSVLGQKFPDVLKVEVRASAPNTFDFDVTVSSPYDTARRYADGFRAKSRDGKDYGERKLFHDHANEQPFTRDLYGVKIPEGIRSVVIEARDQQFGYGGKTREVALPGR